MDISEIHMDKEALLLALLGCHSSPSVPGAVRQGTKGGGRTQALSVLVGEGEMLSRVAPELEQREQCELQRGSRDPPAEPTSSCIFQSSCSVVLEWM